MEVPAFKRKLENMYLELTIDSDSKGNSVVHRAIHFDGKEGHHACNFKSGKCSCVFFFF